MCGDVPFYECITSFLAENWVPNFLTALVIIGGIVAWFTGNLTKLVKWVLGRNNKSPVKPEESQKDSPSFDLAKANATLARLLEEKEKQNRELVDNIQSSDTELQALRQAVEDFSALEDSSLTDRDSLEMAEQQLELGNTEQAETLFSRIENQEAAIGIERFKAAARAAKNIGALAFLHDTVKSVEAYERATTYVPDDPEAWNQLGQLCDRLGQLERAEAAYQQVKLLSNTLEDKEVLAAALGNLGTIARVHGKLDEAQEYHMESLALFERQGNKEGMANGYGNLGNLALDRIDFDGAEEYYNKSLVLNEEIGREEGMANQYGNLGVVAKKRGEFNKAEEYYYKALFLDTNLGNKEGMAVSYGNLGVLADTLGEVDKAIEFYNKAITLNKELGRKQGMAIQYVNLGLLAKEKGKIELAREHWKKSLSLYKEIGVSSEVEKVQGFLNSLETGS